MDTIQEKLNTLEEQFIASCNKYKYDYVLYNTDKTNETYKNNYMSIQYFLEGLLGKIQGIYLDLKKEIMKNTQTFNIKNTELENAMEIQEITTYDVATSKVALNDILVYLQTLIQNNRQLFFGILVLLGTIIYLTKENIIEVGKQSINAVKGVSNGLINKTASVKLNTMTK